MTNLPIVTLLLLPFITAPLGGLAVWKRMGYFGDAASHATLLGVAIALGLNIDPIWGGLIVAIFIGLYLGGINEQLQSADATLGVLAHGGLAGALIISSYMGNDHDDLEHYLFGDVMSITMTDFIAVFTIVLISSAVLYWRWNRMLVSTLNAELASAQGINPKLEMRIFIILLAIGVAISTKAVGALMVGALLVIPSLTARKLSSTPEKMIIISLLLTWISSIIGLFLAIKFNLMSGPAIVFVSFLLFIISRFKNA